MSSTARRVAAVIVVAAVLAATATGSAASSPRAAARAEVGSASGGDPYFPQDGNTGYDVRRYRITDTYRPGRDVLRGTTRIRATATTALTAFHLDLALTPDRVEVDGRRAAFRKTDRHTLRVAPRAALPAGRRFQVDVWYHGRPSTTRAAGIDSPFTHIPGEAVAMGEPQNGAWWFAANETPEDKAAFDIRIRVPRGREAVSNGVLVSRTVGRRWTTWHWRMSDPMTTYLAFFVAGELTLHRGSDGGRTVVWAVSDRLTASQRAHWSRMLRRTPAVVRWLERRFGPYPFAATGGVAVAATDGYALETQSRPVYPGDYRAGSWLLVHELAHQWFGDSVSVRRWRDIWLNEGFATYAEWMWEERRDPGFVDRRLRSWYAGWRDDAWFWRLPIASPGAASIFDARVYDRGAMTLAALRNRVGDDDFGRLLRRWAQDPSRRHGHGTGPEFRALAEEVSGERLGGFFAAWLDARERPADTRANGLGDLTG